MNTCIRVSGAQSASSGPNHSAGMWQLQACPRVGAPAVEVQPWYSFWSTALHTANHRSDNNIWNTPTTFGTLLQHLEHSYNIWNTPTTFGTLLQHLEQHPFVTAVYISLVTYTKPCCSNNAVNTRLLECVKCNTNHAPFDPAYQLLPSLKGQLVLPHGSVAVQSDTGHCTRVVHPGHQREHRHTRGTKYCRTSVDVSMVADMHT